MLVYIIVIFILAVGVYSYDIRGNKLGSDIYYLFELVVLVLLVGLQNRLGGDNLSYEEYFYAMPSFRELAHLKLNVGARFQPLWYLFIAFVKSINNNYTCFHFLHAIFVDSLIFYFFSRHTKYRFSAVLLFFLSFNFLYFNIEIQRESMAIAVFLFSIHFLEEKKYLKYFICAIIALLFHVSSIFTFLLPFLVAILDRYKKSKYFYLKNVLLFTLISYPVYYLMEGQANLGSLLNAVTTQSTYYMQLAASRNNILIAGMMEILPLVLLIKIREKLHIRKDFWGYAILLFMVFVVFNVYITGVYRLKNYLVLPLIIGLIDTTYVSWKQNRQKISVITCYVMITCFIIYTYSRPAAFLWQGARSYNMYIPYRSILNI